jgi:hypothetical protein
VTRVAFGGPAGRLEGLFEEPAGEVLGTAIVCHPHPLHGGTMQNTLVHRTARALRAAGLATLRFDFRGVGGSEGTHDGGAGADGEEGDAAAALDALAERHPRVEQWAAGYSFGAKTVCALATRDARIRRLVLVAPPLALHDCSALERLERPALVVLGSEDPFGSAADLRRLHPRLPDRIEVREVEGADHLFRGRTPAVEELVRSWAAAALSPERA